MKPYSYRNPNKHQQPTLGLLCTTDFDAIHPSLELCSALPATNWEVRETRGQVEVFRDSTQVRFAYWAAIVVKVVSSILFLLEVTQIFLSEYIA